MSEYAAGGHAAAKAGIAAVPDAGTPLYCYKSFIEFILLWLPSSSSSQQPSQNTLR